MKRRTFMKTLSAATLSWAMAGCRPPKQQKPNILFCIADDASYPHMGAYGCKWIKTPAFDRVAKEGILFTNAYTPNAKCAPSRASILTGRNSWQLEQAANHWCYFPEKFKTYAEVLSESGYFVGYTAKGWAPGVALDRDGQKRPLTGTAFDDRKTMPPAEHINTNDYAENFKDFLNARKRNIPFCFWYGSTEPHRAYEYAAGVKKTGKKISEIDRVFEFWPDNEKVRTDLLDYAFEIEWFDQHLIKMLETLEETGELDNTLVVVTADNGMPFPRVKGQVYEASNHLPLAIMWKNGIKHPGRVVENFVSFIDFAPTFLELAGVDHQAAGMQPIQGKSLTDIFRSAKENIVDPQRDHVLIGKERHDIGRPNDEGYPIRGIVKGVFLYIHNFEISRWPACNPETGYLNVDGSPTKTECILSRIRPGQRKYWEWSFGKRPQEELYDIKKDPDCVKNLAENEAYAGIKKQLKDQLFTELKQQGDPRMFGNGHIFDEYLYSDIRHRGFYEKFKRGEKLDAGWVNESDFEKDFE
ncbi:sulfatase [candidate division KSB1 bacterium]|nr:sulfatase [candidate division KSB1 bacterium]